MDIRQEYKMRIFPTIVEALMNVDSEGDKKPVAVARLAGQYADAMMAEELDNHRAQLKQNRDRRGD